MTMINNFQQQQENKIQPTPSHFVEKKSLKPAPIPVVLFKSQIFFQIFYSLIMELDNI